MAKGVTEVCGGDLVPEVGKRDVLHRVRQSEQIVALNYVTRFASDDAADVVSRTTTAVARSTPRSACWDRLTSARSTPVAS